ncbi:ATP-binding protein [Aquimarina sp. I32.4]|uniref:DEAD/DEAH box helicase n=1 Tax=Aquimarina sp. I32.4 TaxID=2053903 RepID=UPI000CDEFBB1|nr:DEAD/DEAH box helicase [Aquimarina sp. I32.4]
MHKYWLNYWKNSLTDSQRLQVDFEREKHFVLKEFDINNGLVPIGKTELLFLDQEQKLNKKKNITDINGEKWIKLKTVDVIFSLFSAIPKVEHLTTAKNNKPAYPFWINAQLNRQGMLSIPEELFPLVPREHLFPSAGKEADFILGDVDNVDRAAAISQIGIKNWSQYVNYLNDVFKEITSQNIQNYIEVDFAIVKENIFFCPEEEQGAASGIINLYHHLLKKNKLPKLLEGLISGFSQSAKKPIEVSSYMDELDKHLGQMGDSFPLSITQRKTLHTFINDDANSVFAVNGPPGTGKTTLLQSVVANEIVKSAINGKGAPIILACSTNNQAVTNINESFSNSQSTLESIDGRWLPDFRGYASYLPSTKKTSFELQNINYIKLDGSGTFQRLESFDYLKKAKTYFLSKMNFYKENKFSDTKQCAKILRDEILETQSSLKLLSKVWKEYQGSWIRFSKNYKSTNPISAYLENGLVNRSLLQRDIEWFKNANLQIEDYFSNESIWRKLGCFFNIKTSLGLRALYIEEIIESSPVTLSREGEYNKLSLLYEFKKSISAANHIIQSIDTWLNLCLEYNIKGTPPIKEEEIWALEWQKINSENLAPCYLYDEIDVTLRHKSFHLAIHYWEARWLSEVSGFIMDSKKDSKGYFPTINRWKIHSMLTPCFVSTFYMASKFFSYWERDDENQGWANPPLLEMIDMLMVDEAGQTTPEVGVAIFGLAKRAIVVGDIKQIEPIWNIPSKIDEGNLSKNKLLDSSKKQITLDNYKTQGVLASNGSLMKMAQRSCRYKEDDVLEKGLLLREHRRCYDEIIGYCNILAYDGQLIPMKGTKNANALFPAIQLINVLGNSTVRNKDRYNQNEVEAIAQFLSENRIAIEQETQSSIESEVGIITPFVGQKRLLKRLLKKKGIDTNKMKIGTVHALQGAERSIIIFSSVYGEGDVGTMFFDRDNKPNMLNVAVSRAKDSFLIFGNEKIFDVSQNTPSGKLARYLRS